MRGLETGHPRFNSGTDSVKLKQARAHVGNAGLRSFVGTPLAVWWLRLWASTAGTPV